MRVGVVLGAGGITGHAFHAGVLAALEDATGFDARSATLLVGTSAGSAVAALVRAGLAGSDLAARAVGAPLSARAREVLGALGQAPAALDPPRPPRGGPSAPGALAAAALRPWRTRGVAVLAAALPEGRAGTEPIQRVFAHLHAGRWPAGLRACAVDLDQGRRVVFGAPAAPTATVAEAVAASCAIPGWYRPVAIAGRRYVDGGAWSPTNADVVGDEDLDVVLVSSPMSAAPRHTLGRLDAAARLGCHAVLRREVAGLRRAGRRVVVVEPAPVVLDALGVNAMDPRRRAAVTAATRRDLVARWRHRAPF